MAPTAPAYPAEALESAIQHTIGPQAEDVDRTGRFPRAAVEALGRAGVLGLMSAPEVDGRGAGLAEAARVIERLAGVCGSTVMVVLMHYAATAVIEACGPEEVRRAVARGTHLSTLAFLEATITALESGQDDAMLRVLEVKAVAGEAAAEVADGVMRLCGGSAFRRELGVERRFRDALAARVMAPTTEALHDFVGRASLGLPLLEEAR